MTKVKEEQAIQVVNKSFQIWGLPRRIKIDNGHPFVSPRVRDTPRLSVLWWIGLGIEVVLNPPGKPQENGTVEGLQRISKRWANPKECTSVEALQKALDETGHIQRGVYRIPAKKYKTRLELYPELNTNPRKFDPKSFSMAKVEKFLTKQVWERRIKKNGYVCIFGKEIYVGYQFPYQKVTITFDPSDRIWMIRALDGRLLRTSTKALVTEKLILTLANISKN